VSSSKPEPDQVLPFLQGGGARNAFVSGAYEPCLKQQRDAPANASLTTSQLGDFCLCYGRAVADTINSREYQDLDITGVGPSLVKKQIAAANLCQRRMRADQQSTVQERDVVAVTQECLKTYHPNDTNFAAALVHNKFCTCLDDKEFAEALSHNSPSEHAATKAKQVIDHCSKQLLID
jgi:hypothetical protein